MLDKIDGLCFINMLDYGVRNLHKHQGVINKLNVFPVPDGDTGVNMVTTVQKGISSVEDSEGALPVVSKKFADSVVFSARGNSGVILSQFLKGVCEGFYEIQEANAKAFVAALELGVASAYDAVAKPVEGTMLTVVKDATAAVKSGDLEGKTINEVISMFVEHAKACTLVNDVSPKTIK